MIELNQVKKAAVIYVGIGENRASFGRNAARTDETVKILGNVLYEAELAFPQIILQKRAGLDFFLYVSLGEADTKKPLEICHWIKQETDKALAELKGSSVQIGFAVLSRNDVHDPAHWLHLINQSIVQAKKRSQDWEMLQLEEDFQNILISRNVRTVYQPIVSLMDGTVFGYESLLRGPENSEFHSPLKLFQFAEQNGSLYALDRLAREKAIEGFRVQHKRQRVFINLPSNIIHDPNFSPGQTLKLLHTFGLTPENVVFEITERSSIEDFSTVKQVLKHYRKQGYQIAIDDAGAGYSSLQAIAELRPDFVKVDRSLVDRIDDDKAKEYMLETFIHFSRKMNIRLIAEGIEREADLYKLIRMGFHYGQGYLLGKPQPELIDIPEKLRRGIASYSVRPAASSGLPNIKELTEQVKTFPTTTTVSEAADYFHKHEDQYCAVVVRGDANPVGLLMKEQLFQLLSVPYGISLYSNKPVETVMDKRPLIASGTLPVDQVSQMAMMREKAKLYDVVIVTENDQLLGIATIQSILDSMTNARVEFAKVLNPLTHLPGNTQIEAEMKKRLNEQSDFSVIYIDLDNFKWFNDAYGFQMGDEMILSTVQILQDALRLFEDDEHFLGHIGGDDFIIITKSPQVEEMCQTIVHNFDQTAANIMEEMPYVPVRDRKGNVIPNGRLSVSLGVVTCGEPNMSIQMISDRAAKVKMDAKAQEGSVYVMDSK